MLTPIKSLSILHVMIRSMSLPICSRFHATRANSVKIITFWQPFLTLACAGLPEPRGSGLRLLKSTFTAENLIFRLSWSISSHFVAIQRWNVRCIQNLRKIYQKFFLWVQGRSRSSMLTNLRSPSPVLVMICSKSVPVGNRFYTIRANSAKITFFKWGVHLFDALVRE